MQPDYPAHLMPSTLCAIIKQIYEMRALFILSLLITICNTCFSQMEVNGSDWLEKSIADSIYNTVKVKINEVVSANMKMNEWELGFLKDTLEIELYLDAAIRAVNYSDISTMRLTYEALEKYDVLLNKYYKKLLANAVNKKALIEAQRAWIAFRDKQIDFYSYEIAGDTDLSNLGTLDRVAIAAFSLKLTKNRTIELFNGLK